MTMPSTSDAMPRYSSFSGELSMLSPPLRGGGELGLNTNFDGPAGPPPRSPGLGIYGSRDREGSMHGYPQSPPYAFASPPPGETAVERHGSRFE
jgi:hypothetical protein